ncbi:hypothetical protein [Mesorhizobium sp. Cs1299R1N3]|uniref:hypothetical protein n=1 Tax=Mesorhizobium sp. Cs1299R1N3 TaxID=3015173 RepID=UPI00301DE5A2
MRRLLAVPCAMLLAAPAGAATLDYGSRVGMELTIVKKSGIGSTHASILARHDRRNARVYCREYGHDFTEECIDAEMKAPLHFEITANCKAGEFTTFYGAKMLFQGRNKGTDVPTDYRITAVDENMVLDGSGASGYDYTLEQFKALCPNRVK